MSEVTAVNRAVKTTVGCEAESRYRCGRGYVNISLATAFMNRGAEGDELAEEQVMSAVTILGIYVLPAVGCWAYPPHQLPLTEAWTVVWNV